MIPYLVIVFLATWLLWFAADASTPPWRQFLFYPGVFMPGIVALGLTYARGGVRAVESLVAKLVKVDVGAKWFVFALLYMAVIKLTVAVIVRIVTGAWPIFGEPALPLMFGAAIVSTLLGGQVGEELGWRGYALPRMAKSMGLGPAAILLGIIWATWHVPLFFILTGDTVGQSFPFYLLQVTAISVAIAWLYLKTGGSLLLTMLLHAAINNTKDIVPSVVPGASNPWLLHASLPGWLTLGLLWLCAGLFLFDIHRNTNKSATFAQLA